MHLQKYSGLLGEMERNNKILEFWTSNDRGITSDQKKESGITKVFDPAFSSSFFQLPHKLQNYVKVSHSFFVWGYSLWSNAMIMDVVFM